MGKYISFANSKIQQKFSAIFSNIVVKTAGKQRIIGNVQSFFGLRVKVLPTVLVMRCVRMWKQGIIQVSS